MNYYLGIDFGTSGVRGVVIDKYKRICFEKKTLLLIQIV